MALDLAAESGRQGMILPWRWHWLLPLAALLAALGLHSSFTEHAFQLHETCNQAAPGLHSGYTGPAFQLHGACIPAALRLHSSCTGLAF